MYTNVIHKEGFQFSPGSSRSLPRPLAPGGRARSRSPCRPHLALVICPDYCEYSSPGSPALSPLPSSTSRFPYPPSPRPVHHSLARTRGDYSLRDTSSLPCSPVLQRTVHGGLGRDLSLPGSPNLPRMKVQDYSRLYAEVFRLHYFITIDATCLMLYISQKVCDLKSFGFFLSKKSYPFDRKWFTHFKTKKKISLR